MLKDFARHNSSHQRKKITQWEIDSDLIKRAGKGEITMLLTHLQNYPNRLQVRALNRVCPSCYLFHDSSKEYEQATAGAWTLPFSTVYQMPKMGADTGPEVPECYFLGWHHSYSLQQHKSCYAWAIQSVRPLNMCRFVLALVQAMLPFRQTWALWVCPMEAVMTLIQQSPLVHI